MKKRMLFPLILGFAILLVGLQGCGSSAQCVSTVFPGGTNGQIYYVRVNWSCDGYRQRYRVGYDGKVYVPRRCAPSNCSGIYWDQIFNSFTFNASPSSIDLQSPPSSITFSNGGGIDTTYGSPQVAYFDDYGGYIGEGSVTGSGSDWVTATTPDLSNAYSGSYTVQISNKQADGSWAITGEASGTTWNRDPPPGGGGGGGGDDGGGGCDPECNMY
jgi:hypothetical protein